jgi:hypothetical protein
MILITGCSFNPGNAISNNSEIIQSDFLEKAAAGELGSCEYSIHPENTGEKIRTEKGTPEWEGYYDGGYGLRYGNCTYYVEVEGKGKMTAIDLMTENVSLTPAQIKEFIGTPQDEGVSDIDGLWFLYYQAGDFEVYFNFQNETANVMNIRLK